MKTISAIFVAVLAAFLSGCNPAVSIRPLYTDADLEKPINEPRIEGEWVSVDTSKSGADNEPWLKWKIAPPRNLAKLIALTLWSSVPPNQTRQKAMRSPIIIFA
jgi:hypothetical protein